jgi:subtilisin family serine protease
MPSKVRAALVCAVMLFCALLPATASAEAKYRYTAQAVPSDELFEEQWSLADDRLLGVQDAWDVSTGGSTVVAVIDTGADLTHPDLRDNLWRNAEEIPGNGIDDDGNGFVDDVNGADFVNRDGDPSDDNGHGTHVAGILAARGANRVGVTGVAQRARLMVLKALGADAVGSAETMAEAVRYAVANGAKIINMSVSGPGRSQTFEEAVQAASDAGVLMTVAAGNSGHDLDVAPEYPAAFPASHVIAVAATGRTGKLIGISNRGVGTVDIAAPGQGIVSTARGGDYEIRTGTSMASPHVAGALVLLSSARPDLGADALQAALLGSARRGVAVTTGTLDVAGAMRRMVSAARWRSAIRASSVRGASKSKAKRARGRAS